MEKDIQLIQIQSDLQELRELKDCGYYKGNQEEFDKDTARLHAKMDEFEGKTFEPMSPKDLPGFYLE